MEALPVYLLAFLAVCMVQSGLALECYSCSDTPGGDSNVKCTSANLTKITCGPYTDRCYTTKVKMMGMSYTMRDCTPSRACIPKFQYNPCKVLEGSGIAVESCDMKCCDSNLCDPYDVAMTPVVPASTKPPTSSLKCQACGPGENPCDDANVKSVDCEPFADRCMTVYMTMGSLNMVMKNCAHSTMNCQEQSQYYACKLTASTGASCNATCCQGDLCNKASSGAEPATVVPTPSAAVSSPITPGDTEPPSAVVPASSLKCQSCGPGNPCGHTNVKSIECEPFADRCMTVHLTMGPVNMVMKNCAHSTMNCQEQGQYYICKSTASTGASCNVTCCQGDLCNKASSGAEPATVAPTPSAAVSSPITPGDTEPPSAVVPASSLRCQSCGPGMGSCDGDDVKSMECPPFADRCMTVFVAMTIPNLETQMTMVMKSCSNSMMTCQEQSKLYPCKQLQDYQQGARVTACKVTCCKGDLCNQASSGSVEPTIVAPRPSASAVTGRWRRVNSSPVCFKAKDNQYGKFSVPSSGKLAAIKLVHLYGYLSCDTRSNTRWSYWGCAVSKVNVVITTSANRVILPPKQFISNAVKWSKIPGYSSLSNEIVLSVISRPLWVHSGQELRLWFGEDLVNQREGDNGGRVCCDVYALYV